MTETATTIAPVKDHKSIWMWMKEVAFTQEYIDVNGIRTRVVTAGDRSKPALLLIHGTGGHWEAYAPSIGALAQEYFVIAPDLVGNGFSTKPKVPYTTHFYMDHLIGVLDHFGVEKASIFGMSLGAWIAARFGVDKPERVEKLVLMSPAGLLARAENMARIKRQRTAAVTNPDWATIKAMFDHLIADEDNKIDDIIALRQSVYRLPETLETIDSMLTLQEEEVRKANLLSEDEWRSIQAPTLVVVASKDVDEYMTTSHQILRFIPNSEPLLMPNVAHWPCFEDPEVFNPAALAFLAKDA